MYRLALFLILCSVWAEAQFKLKENQAVFITYETLNHDKIQENDNSTLLISNESSAILTTLNDYEGKSDFPFEGKWILQDESKVLKGFILNENEGFFTEDSTDIAKQPFEFLAESKIILGYKCNLAKTIINSNTIELWYVKDSNVKGSPYILGQNLGLVLEITRNNNYTIRAKKISAKKVNFPDYLKKIQFKKVDKLTLNDKIWKSKFITIPIFQKQQIHFSEEFTARENVMRFANGTIVVKKMKIPLFGSSDKLFIDLTEQSNGDAYDRTGSIFLIPTDKKQSFLEGLEKGAKSLPVYNNGNGKEYQGVVATKNYSPLVELMRFFTPFGVHHFNDRFTLKDKAWQDSAFYRQDITDYAKFFNGKEVYIGVFIGNYDKGGHQISLNLTIHKETSVKANPTKIIPLFNTLNVMEMAGQNYGTMFNSGNGLQIEFELKESLRSAKLRYTTTGHGGWENGDEFVPKKNSILLNGKAIFDVTPWREDCGSYRLYNPVSGNFSNGLSSSDYSRSNWCPGMVTNPYFIELGDLTAGKHIIQVIIPQGEPEGTSFSAWNVSGVLVGD
ncbi:MAG: PNGase F N-terminal domain-containing protein [Moheibacter sp.]